MGRSMKWGLHIKINEVERLVGVTKKNIRYYEEMGLVSPDRNSQNGYREYDERDIEDLRRVKLFRKLSMPIEEIRKVQNGTLTLSDAMHRQGIVLEREKENLLQIRELCGKIIAEECSLETLDTQTWLFQMGQMEKEGTRFMDVKNNDRKRRKLTRAALAAVVFIVIMAAVIVFLLWAFAQENRPPLGIMIVFLLIPAVLIVGVMLALIGRIREIRGGEEDAACKY